MKIDIPVVESLFANSCFVILFLTTLYYWSKIIFDEDYASTEIGLLGYGSAVFCLTTHLILRWFYSGHFPLSNLYESLIFLAWCLLILHIYIEKSMRTAFLGVFTAPAILCLVAFTDFSLPPELQQAGPLVPALQSNWLIMHVTVMIASYAALLLGCLIAIAYLIFSTFFEKTKILSSEINQTLSFDSKQVLSTSDFSRKGHFGVDELKVPTDSLTSANSIVLEPQKNFSYKNDFGNTNEITSFSKNSVFGTNGVFGKGEGNKFFEVFALQNAFQTTGSQNQFSGNKFLFFLDNLSYRIIGIGFCFLTLGILSGAVWANETWGNYWSWDPKETWAFITWLTFACYLHSRLVGGWTGSKPAWIASFGFIIVWVCYLGVNLLGQGLHSYGFLQI